MTNAILTGANFAGATLTSVTLTNANLVNTIFSGATLTSVNATNALLMNTTFASATLTTSNFSGSNLTAVNLSGATLTATNFINTNLTGADFSGAIPTTTIWGNTICPDSSNSDNHGASCLLSFTLATPGATATSFIWTTARPTATAIATLVATATSLIIATTQPTATLTPLLDVTARVRATAATTTAGTVQTARPTNPLLFTNTPGTIPGIINTPGTIPGTINTPGIINIPVIIVTSKAIIQGNGDTLIQTLGALISTQTAFGATTIALAGISNAVLPVIAPDLQQQEAISTVASGGEMRLWIDRTMMVFLIICMLLIIFIYRQKKDA
jgi:hypothetical protein